MRCKPHACQGCYAVRFLRRGAGMRSELHGMGGSGNQPAVSVARNPVVCRLHHRPGPEMGGAHWSGRVHAGSHDHHEIQQARLLAGAIPHARFRFPGARARHPVGNRPAGHAVHHLVEVGRNHRAAPGAACRARYALRSHFQRRAGEAPGRHHRPGLGA